MELFVLDDDWFGKRNNNDGGLRDWYINKDSDLYKEHPEWVLESLSRNSS